MGYYSDRLRRKLQNMSREEKDDLWNKLSYLNEMGPVVTEYKIDYEYSVVGYETNIKEEYPSTYEGEISNRFAA